MGKKEISFLEKISGDSKKTLLFRLLSETREPKERYSNWGATTLSITTLGIKTLSIIGLFATLSINDIQHNVSSVIMLSIVITLMLC